MVDMEDFFGSDVDSEVECKDFDFGFDLDFD